MSNTGSWIAITSCLSSSHQFRISSVSEGDRMDASSFLSLPVITGGEGGVSARGRSVQEVCNVQLRRLVKWVSSF